MHAMVLTKNPDMAGSYDLDLLCNENVWLGTTLTALTRIDDEPYAPANDVRASDLYLAHGYGVKTWVSIEPAIPGKTDYVGIIKATYPFVDWYVLGRLDYETRFGYPKIPKGFYTPMLREAVSLLKALGKPYHIKKQLAENP